MAAFSQSGNALLWRDGRRRLEIQAWGRDVIRVRETLNAAFADVPGALVGGKGTKGTISIQEGGATLRSGTVEARVNPYGRIGFFTKGSDNALLQDVNWKPDHPPLYPPSRAFHSLDSDLYRIEARFLPQEGERFYGLGQHRHGLLDQKGAVVELMQRNAEVSIPFLVSSRRYGFLWNNPAIGRVELGRTGTRWVAEAARQLDYLVVGGADYAAIMGRYADMTGHPPALPEWASGFWQCKLRYGTQDELLEVAREYKRRGLPLSVIVSDFFHWPRQGDWEFDPKMWPDPEAMTRELEEMGVKLMVSIWPSVNPRSYNAEAMRDRGLLIGTNHGVDVLFPFIDTYEEPPVYVHYYDATHPEGRQFIWDRCKENYWDKGVALFWLDACEPEINPLEHGNLRFHVGSGLEVANIYPLLHEQGFYEGMKMAGAESVVNLCRSAWAGSQRYGAAVWSGDIMSDWETLRGQVKAGLNIAMSGIPWWTTDIGGFHGGNPDDPAFRELVVRWFQYGVFCPLFRLHGVREPRRSEPYFSGADNEVWSYGEEAYAIIRDLLLLRERLRPYIMDQMRTASATGVPPMRPLFFDYPGEDACYDVEDEFLFGPDILVAPIQQGGARSRQVYLPSGASWTNAWTGDKAVVGERFDADAPLERIPVYVREGASVRLTE